MKTLRPNCSFQRISLVIASTLFVLFGYSKPITFDQPNDHWTSNHLSQNFTPPPPPLMGTYTVGGAAPDYATITAAKNDLVLNGISSAVIFDIRPGTYLESVEFPAITGSSAANTITFQAENGDSSSVIIQHPSGSLPSDFIIRTNGASHFVFSKITLDMLGPTGQTAGFRFYNQSHFITVQNVATLNSNQRIAIQSEGSSGLNTQGLIVRNSELTGDTAIFVRYAQSPIIYSNQINTGRYSHFWSCNNVLIKKNDVVAYNGGFEIFSCESSRLINNTIYLTITNRYMIDIKPSGSSSTIDSILGNTLYRSSGNGIALSYSPGSNAKIVMHHNTVDVRGFGVGTASIGTTNWEIYNNIFRSSSLGIIGIGTSTGTVSADYNIYFKKGAMLMPPWYLFAKSSAYSTFAAWQGAGYDANSLFVDPKFYSDLDVHLRQGSPAIGFGNPAYNTYSKDRDGENRATPNATNPDIGSDENPLASPASPLSGVYTIGGAAPDFTTINDAKDALIERGVGGAITMNIRPGTYNEQVHFDTEVCGNSAFNSVTFQAENGDSSTVVWQWNNTVIDVDSSFILRGVLPHFTFQNLTFKRLSPSYNRGIYLARSDSAKIKNCRIETGPPNFSSYAAILLYGTASQNLVGCQVIESTIVALNGIRANYNRNLIVQDSYFDRGGSGTGTGVVLSSCQNSLLTGNSFRQKTNGIVSSGGSYLNAKNNQFWYGTNGISYSNGDVRSTVDSIQNNFFYSSSRGIWINSTPYASSPDTFVLRHNTFRGGSYSVFNGVSGYINLEVYNNIFDFSTFWLANTTTYQGDNNLFGTTADWHQSTTYNDLSSWQLATGQDPNSIQAEPKFYNSPRPLYELKSGSPAIGAANPAHPFPADIEGNLRSRPSGSIPDIGVYEDSLGTPCILSGTYTVGGSSPDFLTIEEAGNALSDCQVAGNVTFDIRPGIYYASLQITNPCGITATDTITFKAENGDSSSVVWRIPAGVTGGNLINFSIWPNTATLMLENLTMEQLIPGSFVSAISTCETLIIESCRLEGSMASSSFVYSCANGLITKSTIISPIGCQFSGLNEVNNCVFNEPSGVASSQGIRITGGTHQVRNSLFTTDMGIYIQSGGATLKQNRLFTNDVGVVQAYSSINDTLFNNAIICPKPIEFFSSGGGSKMHLAQNTLRATGVGEPAIDLDASVNVSLEMFNNIVESAGHAIKSTNSIPITGDGNLYYKTSGGPVTFDVNSTTHANLAAWQSATGQDANSFDANPQFVAGANAYNIQPSSPAGGLGLLAHIRPEDIDGENRPQPAATNPDAGVDEMLQTACTPLAGIYTIGGTAPDYSTINLAKDDLIACGISATVIFDIRPGTYTEQVDFTAPVVGSSAANTVTFQAENGDSSSVIWEWNAPATGPSDGFIVKGILPHFIFKDITFKRNAPTYNIALNLPLSDSLRIESCRFETGNSTTPTQPAIYTFGSPSALITGLEVTKSTIVARYGIYCTQSYDLNFNKNVFEGGFSTTGIYLILSENATLNNNSFQFIENGINISRWQNLVAKGNKFTSVTRGLFYTGSDNLTTIDSIHNNFFFGGQYGIFVNAGHFGGSSDTIVLKHNTFRNVNHAVYRVSNGPFSLESYNNLFDPSSWAYHFPGAYSYKGDFNLYSPGTDYRHLTTTINNLAGWQTALSQDANSVEKDPKFILFPNDSWKLRGGSPAIGAGNQAHLATPDFEGKTRPIPSGSNPDLGAYEHPYASPCALSGIYTVGGASPDFSSIADVDFALRDCGISADVVFNIRPGTYADDLYVGDPICGMIAGRDITFQAENGDSSSVIWQKGTSFLGNPIIQINSQFSGEFHFNNLTFERNNPSANAGIILSLADSLTITSCHFEGTMPFNYLVAANLEFNMFNSTIKGLFGCQVNSGSGIIEKCIFDIPTVAGVSLGLRTSYSGGMGILENTFITHKGIEINNGSANNIFKNKIFSSDQGIEYTGGYSNWGKDSICNNAIISLSPVSAASFASSGSAIVLKHNTIKTATGATSAFDFGPSSNYALEFHNNVVSSHGHIIEGDNALGFVGDGNLYHKTSGASVTFDISGTTHANLAAWQTATSQDANSLDGDPLFVAGTNAYNIQPSSPAGGLGQPAHIRPDDIDGENRPQPAATNPDAGADEMVQITCTPLAGTYTIGGTAPDYATFTAAQNDLIACGISAPTIFDVRPGTYNEVLNFPPITGSSTTNTIIFQAETGDSSSVTLTSTTTNTTLTLNGASNFIFQNLSIVKGAAGITHRALDFFETTNVTVQNCYLTTLLGGEVLNAIGSAGALISDLKIKNNLLWYASEMMHIDSFVNVEISDNNFGAPLNGCIFLKYGTQAQIVGNTSYNSSGNHQVNLFDVSDFNVERNEFYSPASLGSAGLRINRSANYVTGAGPSTIVNNFFKANSAIRFDIPAGAAGEVYEITNNSLFGDFYGVFHNSFGLTDRLEVYNNIIYGDSYSLELGANVNLFSDYNLFDQASGFRNRSNGTNYNTLATWHACK